MAKATTISATTRGFTRCGRRPQVHAPGQHVMLPAPPPHRLQRAARIMEIMEEKGIVGPENGSSRRNPRRSRRALGPHISAFPFASNRLTHPHADHRRTPRGRAQEKGISIRERRGPKSAATICRNRSNHFDIGLTKSTRAVFSGSYAKFLRCPPTASSTIMPLGRGKCGRASPAREIYGAWTITVASAGEPSDRAAPPEETPAEPEPARTQPTSRVPARQQRRPVAGRSRSRSRFPISQVGPYSSSPSSSLCWSANRCLPPRARMTPHPRPSPLSGHRRRADQRAATSRLSRSMAVRRERQPQARRRHGEEIFSATPRPQPVAGRAVDGAHLHHCERWRQRADRNQGQALLDEIPRLRPVRARRPAALTRQG